MPHHFFPDMIYYNYGSNWSCMCICCWNAFWKLVNLWFLHEALIIIISRYVRMKLFRIENQYYYGLKILEPQVHQLNENRLEDLKELELLKMSTLWNNLFCKLLHFQPVTRFLLCNCLIKKVVWCLLNWDTIATCQNSFVPKCNFYTKLYICIYIYI